ncbi:MAG: ABC transporter ATP-binding protein [Candidatus Melainabacteria bacterium]|nr:ABC transporter ATP-binding protein [Candidatus Melainabacteria bacterium]
MSTGISARDLTKVFKGGSRLKLGPLSLRLGRSRKIKALDNLSLDIPEGEALGLIGPNGAGKTTFLTLLLGYLRPDRGEVLIDGLKPNTIGAKRLVGYLPERLNFDHWMSGYEFLEYHHALAERAQAERKKEIEGLLELVALEQDKWTAPLKTYSRGMLQRLGLAQALIGRPRYLLLDEPASGIDPRGVVIIKKILKSLKSEGMTLLLNSHQLDQVEQVCDRVVFLEHGKIVRIEDMKAEVEAPRLLMIRFSAVNLDRLTRENLESVGNRAGAQLISLESLNAGFKVNSNAVAVGLIRALVEADLPVIEATPDQGRLERLFGEGPEAESQDNQ